VWNQHAACWRNLRGGRVGQDSEHIPEEATVAISGINHVNIRTLDIARTVQFYTRALGFRYGGPEVVDGFTRHWLYDQTGRPIIHLRELAPSSESTGAIDHVAFSCDDIAGVLDRMTAEAVRFARRDNPADGLVQIFLTDPNGIALELNFPFP
jgi:catechol 2,3-dioxygenase-like lactoylglutathione lyase family enzyme